MEIDLSFLETLSEDPIIGIIEFLQMGGWIIVFVPLLIFLAAMVLFLRMAGKQKENIRKTKGILLAVDLPLLIMQTPKAVEHIFAQLSAVQKDFSWYKRVILGKIQERFSFEIASIDGYVQFCVWTPEEYRDLIEAAIYAQYPEAEIVEVNDYTNLAPAKFPNDTYELWGAELKLTKEDVYPIRTHPYFEDTITKEFKDPMAAILELLNKLRSGEQIWVQIVVSPADDSWKEKGERIVADLIGKKVEYKSDLISKGIGVTMKGLGGLSDLTRPPLKEGEKRKPRASEKEGSESSIQHLSPGQRVVVEAIEEKISKIGYNCKIRLLYLAKKEIYHEGRGVAALVGVFSQFSTLNLNRFKVSKVLKGPKPFPNRGKAQRQTRFLWAYRRRRYDVKGKPIILNTEELASLYHFPTEGVKAPSVQKTEAKRSEPPFTLPVE